ncbi:MAG: YbhB/YbcL family Raf kinase inhibitor-like protein [Acidimicrobiia bacterium]|nr:YbhB/YbcL family Raf kinase inhibitor-like protein [Acidimicrobiia bacterium]
MKISAELALAIATLGLAAQQAAAQGFQLPNMQVRSSAFEDGGIVPLRFTSHGQNVQPDFRITGAPDTTKSFVVIMHDIEVALGGNPDDVTHWVAFNIPSPNIPEGKLPEGSVNGNNIRNQPGYMGSGAPLKDRFHHYVWEFYALNATLDLPAGATREQVTQAMRGKVVAKAAYVGRYANAKP